MIKSNENIPLDLATEAAVFIKEKRIAMGISQYKLSEMVFGNTNQRIRISQMESGKQEIGLKTMGKILSALNCYIEFKERD